MLATFVELPAFARRRERYLDDAGFARVQKLLMVNPMAGRFMPDTGGLRKLRVEDVRRGKGKRGGLRVIYYYWIDGPEFWLFTLYDKDEADDLSPAQKEALRQLMKLELEARTAP